MVTSTERSVRGRYKGTKAATNKEGVRGRGREGERERERERAPERGRERERLDISSIGSR